GKCRWRKRRISDVGRSLVESDSLSWIAPNKRSGAMPRLTFGPSLFAAGVLAGLVWATASAQVAGQRNAPVPDFSSGLAGLVNLNGDFQPVAGAPAPSRSDPAHPYVSNQAARQQGIQP